jgi:hypothetical protein
LGEAGGQSVVLTSCGIKFNISFVIVHFLSDGVGYADAAIYST